MFGFEREYLITSTGKYCEKTEGAITNIKESGEQVVM
jgi:hypothetical protein